MMDSVLSSAELARGHTRISYFPGDGFNPQLMVTLLTTGLLCAIYTSYVKKIWFTFVDSIFCYSCKLLFTLFFVLLIF